DTAILHGPGVANAAEIFARLDAAGAAAGIADAAALAAALAPLLTDPPTAKLMAAAGRAVVADGVGALARTLAALQP
ncbi:hypothetical protein J8J40_35130, partial [Mycobacterium tuberculosis]|nr:hypothetical protein [Mycobacterium tuberculosis]